MKPIRRIDIILIACGAAFSCITSVSASAQETGTFMRNPAESRTMSLAGAGVVSLDDVSVLDNAALSPFSLNRFSAGVSCQSWMKNVSGGGMPSYSISVRYTSGKAGTVYLGMRSLKTPPFEQTDDYGNVVDDTAKPGDMAFEMGYAHKFCGDFSAALTARYLRLDPGYGNAANAVSFDAGLSWRHIFKGVMEDIAAIAQLKNFGTSPDYGSGRRSLPWLVNAGASAGLLAGKHNRFRAGASLDISVAPTCGSLSPSRGVSASFGAEYSYRRMVYARGGYHLGNKSAGEQRWASVGLGFRFWHMTLDAALILTPSSSPLHDTASGTLSIWF